MAIKVNIKSLLIGFLLGTMIMLALGATSNPRPAVKYQLGVHCNADGSFVFARMNSDTGEIEARRIGILSIFPKTEIFMPAKR